LAIESSDYQERLSKATVGLAGRIAETQKTVCPVDAVQLKPSGVCPVCARQFAAAPLNSSLTAEERKRAIESGAVPSNTAGLSDDERKQAAFWQRKKHPKGIKEQSMAEKTDKFFREVVTTGPNGERIVQKRLVEM